MGRKREYTDEERAGYMKSSSHGGYKYWRGIDLISAKYIDQEEEQLEADQSHG